MMKTTMGQKIPDVKGYEKDFNKRLRDHTDVKDGPEVFLNLPPQIAYASNHIDELANKPYRKLVPKSIGPLEGLEMGPNAVLSEEDGFFNRVSIHHMSPIPIKQLDDIPSRTILDQEGRPAPRIGREKTRLRHKKYLRYDKWNPFNVALKPLLSTKATTRRM